MYTFPQFFQQLASSTTRARANVDRDVPDSVYMMFLFI